MNNKTIAVALTLGLFAGMASAQDDDALVIASDGGTVGPGAGGLAEFTRGTPDALFVKESFNFSLSPNVALGALETQSVIGVATINTGGRYHFGGSYGGSESGGTVEPCEDAPLLPEDDKAIATPTDAGDPCTGNGG